MQPTGLLCQCRFLTSPKYEIPLPVPYVLPLPLGPKGQTPQPLSCACTYSQHHTRSVQGSSTIGAAPPPRTQVTKHFTFDIRVFLVPSSLPTFHAHSLHSAVQSCSAVHSCAPHHSYPYLLARNVRFHHTTETSFEEGCPNGSKKDGQFHLAAQNLKTFPRPLTTKLKKIYPKCHSELNFINQLCLKACKSQKYVLILNFPPGAAKISVPRLKIPEI